jgi:hypothetical protein
LVLAGRRDVTENAQTGQKEAESMARHKMAMAIVDRAEALLVLEALIAAGYTATFSDSRSGFLR